MSEGLIRKAEDKIISRGRDNITIHLWSTRGLRIRLLHAWSHQVTVTEAVPTLGQPSDFWPSKGRCMAIAGDRDSQVLKLFGCLMPVSVDGRCLLALNLHSVLACRAVWLIINALLLAGKITSPCCPSIFTLHSLLFSLIYCYWVRTGQYLQAQNVSSRLHYFKELTATSHSHNHRLREQGKQFYLSFTVQNPDASELEKPHRERGDAEVTQGEGFSPLFLCLRG